jgi:leucyl aminopeptidase
MPHATTHFTVVSQPSVTTLSADALIIAVFHQKDAAENGFAALCSTLKTLDDTLGGQLLAQAHEEKFEGAKGKLLHIRTGGKLPYKRLVLVGLGEEAKIRPSKVESAFGAATASLLGLKQFEHLAVLFPGCTSPQPAQTLYALVDGMVQATYASKEAKKPGPNLAQVTVLSEPGETETAVNQALPVAQALASARAYAKDYVNMPSNIKTTQVMVEAANALASLPHVNVNVVDDVAWIKEHMPSFYCVAQGSLASDPPKFITVTYAPPNAKQHVAYVGKTVIFDTGGYQVKTGNYMVTMKGDMTGGAMVLATIQALAQLKAPIGLTAYLAATPNKIDSDAFIPDSIVNSTCGKKIEIRHTDAEGRLTLIDAVTKAAEAKPDSLLTIATLTGAAKMAVGQCVAIMSAPQHEALRNQVQAAAKYLDEPFQSLDMFESDFEDIKSKLDAADIRNTNAGEGRGSQTAGAFVMLGAPDTLPMVHLDIAGADMTKDEKATGTAQKTLILHALQLAGVVSL